MKTQIKNEVLKLIGALLSGEAKATGSTWRPWQQFTVWSKARPFADEHDPVMVLYDLPFAAEAFKDDAQHHTFGFLAATYKSRKGARDLIAGNVEDGTVTMSGAVKEALNASHDPNNVDVFVCMDGKVEHLRVPTASA